MMTGFDLFKKMNCRFRFVQDYERLRASERRSGTVGFVTFCPGLGDPRSPNLASICLQQILSGQAVETGRYNPMG
jgi:hypothetical protein